MACSIPVVASKVGANKDIIINNLTGILAETNDDWISSLLRLSNDRSLQISMGNAGNSLFKEKYSLEVKSIDFLKIVNSII
jgi:glycosyltransferase involved in cell wall biosynthesis